MKHWKIFLWLLAALFAFNSCEFKLDGGTGGGTEAEGLSGQLVDSRGEPIADAAVRVYSLDSSQALAKAARQAGAYADSTSTDSHGRYSFPDLKNGLYNLVGSFEKDNALQTVFIPSILFQQGVDLGADTLRLSGSILVQATSDGLPLEGVQCYVPGSSFIAISDDSGHCLITGVPPGNFQVRLRYNGLLTDTTATLQVQSGQTTRAGNQVLVADPALAPPQATGLSVQYDSVAGVVTLSWKAVQVSDLAGYIVYRRQDLTQVPQRISLNLLTDTVFRDTLPDNGVSAPLIYQVKAQDRDGNLSEVYSDPVSITPTPARHGRHFLLNASTVALWTFDTHSNGVFTDASPNAFGLSNAGNFALTPSPFDSAAVFTGSATLAKSDLTHANATALTIAGTGQLTYEARVYLATGQSGAGAGGGWLMGTYDGMTLSLGASGEISAGGQRVRNGTGYWINEQSAAGVVPQNRWFDLAMAFDETTGQVYAYVDGKPVQLYSQDSTEKFSDPFRVSTGNFLVGNDGKDNTFQFSGKIDEIRVSNNLALGAGLPLIRGTPSSDTTHFAKTSSTVALWTFNSRSNGVFKDSSSNAFDLSNADNFTLASSPFDSAVVFTGAGGSGTFASVASNSALTMAGTGKLTYETRVYLTHYPSTANQGGMAFLMGVYEGVHLNIRSNGALNAGCQRVNNGNGYWYGASTSANVVPLNRWVDLAIAFDNSTGQAYAYVDGVPTQLYVDTASNYPSTVNSDPFRVSTSDFAVGANPTDPEPFAGQIDEIRISNNLVLGAGLPLLTASGTMPPAPDTTHFAKTASTVALWSFNSHSGDAFMDSSSNGFNLSNAGNFALISSPFDSAAVLTGSATLAKSDLTHANATALTIAGTGQLTYEARIYLATGQSGAGAGGGWLMGTYDGMTLTLGASGYIDAGGQRVRNGTGYWINEQSSAGIIPQNRWFDLAVAFDETTGQVYAYIDGVPVQLYSEDSSEQFTDPFRVSAGNFFVGNDGQDNAFQFSGKIDEIRVSNNLALGAGLPLIRGTPP